MKLFSKIVYSVTVLLIVFSLCFSPVYANNIDEEIHAVEYSEEFKEYLKLDENEKKNVIPPRMFEIKPKKSFFSTATAILKNTFGAGASEKKYSLKDIIPENIVVRDQKNTNLCWAFATNASLESNLALNNYYSNKTAKIYDFSERHMGYTSTRFFANSAINNYGYNTKPAEYGKWQYAANYLTNGNGPINEEDMPFQDSTDTINISEIQNKNVTARIYDTVEYPSYSSTSDTTEIKNIIKEHVKKYGAISAVINGAALGGDYNNINTGAIYCDDKKNCPINHMVAIIGWDDEFKKENFNEKHQPKNDGAWIIKNSWGERANIGTKQEVKQQVFEIWSQDPSMQITSVDQITDEMLQTMCDNAGYVIEDNNIYIPIGDKGLMYVSYEDINVYSGLHGITKASDTIDYENLYQYNELGYTNAYMLGTSKIYLANVFNKKSSGNEYLSEVSLFIPQSQKCKVYINPTGSSKSKNDLISVELESGFSVNLDPGYHTLKFKQPFEITGNEFTVFVEIEGDNSGSGFYVETNTKELTDDDYAKIESGKCFITSSTGLSDNDWFDLSEINKVNSSLTSADSTLKAFTSTQKPASYVSATKNNPTKTTTTTTQGTINNPSAQTYTDPTVSTQILPYTGTNIILAVIGLISIIALLIFVKKYKNLKDIK